MKTTKKLTKKEQKRVEILKDVLKHIKAQRIVAQCQVIIKYNDIVPKEEENVQKILKNMSKKKERCLVCARGALLFSSIWKNNEFYKKFEIDGWSGDSMLGKGTAEDKTEENGYLEKFFDKNQLAMMETAFEGKFNNSILNSKDWESCNDFNRKNYHLDDTERLEAIIKNAISNRGTFIP